MMKILVLDIETGPVPDNLLSMIIPPFDPDEVKCGNLKDPAKIADKIAEAKANHFDDYKKHAALNALSGQLLAVGMKSEDGTQILMEDEATMLKKTWEAIEYGTMERGLDVVGWWITGFDLPFLIKRSWRHQIRSPLWLRDGRYWNRRIKDLLNEWRMGEYRQETERKTVGNGLGNIAAFLGVGSKSGSGANFAELLRTDRDQARSYLENDLTITHGVAERIL